MKPVKSIQNEIFSIAADFYQSQVSAPDAQDYLRKRGHTPEIVERLKIGWTGERNSLLKHFVSFTWVVPDTGEESTLYKSAKADLLASGLVREKGGKLYDFFPANVVVFPLLEGGAVNHFRFKDPAKKIAYQLPNECRLNGTIFYNQDDFRFDKIILVEGENDVLTVKRILQDERINAGVVGVIGQFSDDQFAFIRDHSNGKEFFCMFDNDGVAVSTNKQSSKGRGYVERFVSNCINDVDIQVINYGADGQDPDDYFRPGNAPGEFKRLSELLDGAQDGVEWLVNQLPDALVGMKAKKSLKPVLPIIAKIKNPSTLEMVIDDVIRRKFPSLKRNHVVEILRENGADVGGAKVQNFEIYDASSQIFISENSYWISSKDGAHRMVSNFILSIKNIFRYEDSQTGESWLKYECLMKNYGNVKSQPVMFEPGDRVNTLKFMEKCAGQGEFRFWGNAQNLSHIWSLVEQDYESKNIVNLVQRFGYLENHGIWICDNCAVKDGTVFPKKDNFLDVNGQGFRSENVLVYGGDRPQLNYSADFPRERLEDIIENFWIMCDARPNGVGNEFKGLLALGFLGATVYRSEIMEHNGSFPELFFYGPSGTGKTTVAQLLFRMFGFVNPPETWESATVASMSQMMSQLSFLPMFLDEFRNIPGRQQDLKISLLRNAWNGAGAGKGGASGIRQIFKILSVIMIAGEDLPTDKGCLSRFVVIRFEGLNSHRNASYQWLMKNREFLSAVFLDLIKKKNKDVSERIPERLRYFDQRLLELGVMDERTRKNYSAILTGFELYNYKENDFLEKFIDFVVAEAQEDISRKQQEDVLQRFFEHVVRLMNRTPFSYSVRILDGGEELAIAFNDFYHDLKKELKQAGDDLDSFKKTTLLEYITKSPFFIKQKDGRRDKSVRFDGDSLPKRAICINISKLPVTIKELFEDMIDFEKSPDF